MIIKNSGSHQNCLKGYFLFSGTHISFCNTWPSFGPFLLIFFLWFTGDKVGFHSFPWVLPHGHHLPYPVSLGEVINSRVTARDSLDKPGRNKTGNRLSLDLSPQGPESLLIMSFIHGKKREVGGQEET